MTFDIDITYDGYPPISTTLEALASEEALRRVRRLLMGSPYWNEVTIRRNEEP